MKKLYVVHPKNTPANCFRGAIYCIVIYTCMKYWQLPLWAEITIMSFFGLALFLSIIQHTMQTPVDLFEDIEKDDIKKESEKAKESFQEKLNRMAKERGVNINK